jgi:hypothetical protein
VAQGRQQPRDPELSVQGVIWSASRRHRGSPPAQPVHRRVQGVPHPRRGGADVRRCDARRRPKVEGETATSDMLLRAVSHSPVPGGGGQRSGLLPAAPRQPHGHAVQRRLLRPGHGAMAAYCNRGPAGRWIRDGLVPRPTRAEWLFGGCLSHIQNSRDGALVLGGRSNEAVDQAILPTLVRAFSPGGGVVR